MITMKKLNVVRVVATEEEAAKLKVKGFERTGTPAEEKPPAGEKSPAKGKTPAKKSGDKDGEPDGSGAGQ